ncbi:family with sequence similarity 114 member A2 [Lamellibrachia satsuma]|nr:family with sequence similarity 114 member A2 [Lamellibrachia satsuma]
MSDSEDGAFESADEGETAAQNKEEAKTSAPQETVKKKTTTEKETVPGGVEKSQRKHTKEKPADKKDKSLNEDTEPKAEKLPQDVTTSTKQTCDKKVENRDTGKGVKKEDNGVKTKGGRRAKKKKGSAVKIKEGSNVTKIEGDGDMAAEGSGIVTSEECKKAEVTGVETTEGSRVVMTEGSKVKTTEDNGVKTTEGSRVKTTESSVVKTTEGSGVKTIEGSGLVMTEGSKTAAVSGVRTTEGSKVLTKESSGAITKETSKVVTTETSRAATTEGSNGNQENRTEKTLPDEETKEEPKPSPGSSKATRRLERRQAPATEEPQQRKSSGWGWGGWGSSILSTATQSVATLTSTVGEGFSTVMETVEAGLGAVSPEELAEISGKGKDGAATELEEMIMNAKKKDEQTEETTERMCGKEKGEKDTDGSTGPVITKQQEATPTGDEKWEQEAATPTGEDRKELEAGDETKGEKELQGSDEDEDISLTALIGGLGSAASVASKWSMSGFSNVRSAVKTTGMTIVTGGLDVLETIGKTTYDVLAEGDVGLKAIMMNARDKPDLSKVLREAKDVAEVKAKENEEFEEARKAHFGAQFDEFQGLVQLEALESLSAECNSGVQTLLNTMSRLNLEDVKPQLVAIKEAFLLKDIDSDDEDEKEQDFGKLVTEHASALGVNVPVQKLLKVEESIKTWLASYQESQDKRSIRQGKEIHQKAIQSLAEFTATTVAFFHRSGQLLLMDNTIPGSMYKKIAANLASLTRVACTEVAILSSMFTQCLNAALASTENAAVVINPLITDVYLEASNSSTYIQDAFQLLLPILQKAAIQVSTPRLRTLSGSSS